MKPTLFLLSLALLVQAQTPASTKTSTPAYDRYLTGSAANVDRPVKGGLLLAGGGTDVQDAFRWLIDRAGGGDIVILRASGADGYHNFIQRLGTVDSIESIVFKSREAASEPSILQSLDGAEAIFLAGGDQSNYVEYWKDTPVEDGIHRAAKRGAPIGGTSAGLAVLSEFGFSAVNGSVTSDAALADPFSDRITLERDFLKLPHLSGIVTDSHFVERDRLGRTLVFLARMAAAGTAPARAIAIDRETAVLVDANGAATIAGTGPAFFLRTTKPASVLKAGTPLSLAGVEVYRAAAGAGFDLRTWRGTGGTPFILSVDNGTITSSVGDRYGR
jgi:cyanophycinase